MKYNNIYIELLVFIVFFTSCNNDLNENSTSIDENKKEIKIVTLKIDETKIYQTIEHFGASDAWSSQFVGNWPVEKKEAIADLLFSQDFDEAGNPKGIGLSLWRFNVGAGSAEQGPESGISDEWRRAESFLQDNGEYNWGKQQGQVWFAKAAKARGVNNLLLFLNSPPVNLTKNGKAFADVGGQSNLEAENYNEFADFLATIIDGLQKKGLPVDYISPVNEPQWDWADGGQEGTPYFNNEIAEIVRVLNQELEHRKLSTIIDVAEAGQINYLYENGNKQGKSNQIQEFFIEGSTNYIGNLSHVGKSISGHSYFTTSPFSNSIEKRELLASAIEGAPELKFWMSEYCILGDNYGEIDGNGKDFGIDPALYIARVIHSDLAVAQTSAWHWWLAVSPYDYKDGLIYIDYQKDDGDYHESKMLWALGNYSRFIRPGFQRISVENSDNNSIDKNFLFSGFMDPVTSEKVFVIVNSGIKKINLQLEFQKDQPGTLISYTTSSEKDMEFQKVAKNGLIEIPPRSIMTITTQNP